MGATMRFSQLVTTTTTIALGSSLSAAYYAPSSTPRIHYRITDYQIESQTGSTVTDVRLQSFNETTGIATDLVENAASGVANGGVATPSIPNAAGYGDCNPLEDLRVYLGSAGTLAVNVGYQIIGGA